MARISAADMRIVEDALGSATGYVADFTNETFAAFFRRDVGVDIYSDDYAGNGTSKGKRLRAFIEHADDRTVLKALRALSAYIDRTGWRVDWRQGDEWSRICQEFTALVERLAVPRPPVIPAADRLIWLAKVQRKLRDIHEVAFTAYDQARDAGESTVAVGVKTALSAHRDILKVLLPEDFPTSAMGDLARHIHFSDLSDMRSIAGFDVPDVMAKAESYALAAEKEDPNGPGRTDGAREDPRDVLSLVDGLFRSTIVDALEAANPDWHMVVLKCCLLLGRRFQDKSGMEDDLGSYGRAFNAKSPTLLVPPDLSTETRRNWQMGAMHLFQGYRAFLRNTHAHDIREGDRTFALQAVAFLSILAEVLAGATPAEDGGNA